MGKEITSHLTLETMGHCLICLKRQTSHPLSPAKKELSESLAFSSASISFLFHLLKIDTGSVVLNKCIWQPSFNISKCNALLCEKCEPLISKLEILYRQLEKIEMSVESHLSLVHTKLLEAEEESDMESEGLIYELETLNAIRTEVVHKCSLKIRGSGPRVKLQRLSRGKISEKLKQSSDQRVSDMIKTEMSDRDDTGNTFPDYQMDNSNNYTYEQGNEEADLDVSCRSTDSEQKVFPDPANKVKITSPKYSNVSDMPSQDLNKCTICLRKFYDKSGLTRHLTTVHQNLLDHRCPICGKKFNARYKLRDHHQVAHCGIKPKCLKCHKVFANKSGLYRHQKKTKHFFVVTPKLPERSTNHIFCCRACKKKFKSAFSLKRHYNSNHLKLKLNACHLCESKFSRKEHLHKHQLRKHSIIHEGIKNQ